MTLFGKSSDEEKQILTKKFLRIADKSIRQTIDMFFKYPSGFHGDTGLQHYLYHRILTNGRNAICWPSRRASGFKTLLCQCEVPTKMTYQGEEAKRPSPGNFDLAFVTPPLNATNINSNSTRKLRALVAFELGRNKQIPSITGDYEAPKEKKNPRPGDAAKIIRDLRYGVLQVGYILEFFDWKGPANYQRAQKIAKELSLYCYEIGETSCRIAVAVIDGEGQGYIRLYPPEWGVRINLKYKQLDFDQKTLPKNVGCTEKKSESGRLIYVPEIFPNTFVHFSWRYESCALRDYSKSANIRPKPDRNCKSSFVEARIEKEEPIIERRNVKDIAFWHKKTVEANYKYLKREGS